MKTWTPNQKSQVNALWQYAGLPSNRGVRLIHMLNQGLPVSVLDTIHEWTQMSKSDILRVTGLNERNIARRKSAGTVLTADESERIARLIRVVDATVHYFGNKQDAWNWLKKPVRGLGDATPLSLIATESGAIEVLDLLGRLEHGVFS
ncbi:MULTISPECIES: antitoxin Xre/MbcA/ParS toxin-binding domain-containing protein [unclassified Enterobacter]|uniref:type II RES/Xre toxin-antitoxin system antitoxin n=1 Tax=unclassified Enterobacter TaxID=2608935 RepID=UPI0008DF86C5|nr:MULTISPECIES: antitoxin Xre/MbcA/ParS toxin-binding domain-containing protein [unclassified Enterobacter]SFQ98422.1 putative toxin-antitoxin system antitoxin component, TIGR02293 family [Enterobacter sp. kpr-6]